MSTERLSVAKYGGSSTASVEALVFVMGAMDANPLQRVVIFSAPGRDEHHPDKVTDLLLQRRFGEFEERMHQIGRGLGWQQRDQVMRAVMTDIREKPFREFRASRGEYTVTRMMADVTGSQFLDAREVIRIGRENRTNCVADSSYELIRQRLDGFEGRVMIPGFYGQDRNGWVRNLPRDGSDITGAVVARALRAGVYQIFSDTAVRTADPRLDPSALVISEMTFDQLDKLAASGAKVVHPQVAGILRGTGTSINCLNTFDREDPGTWISGVRL